MKKLLLILTGVIVLFTLAIILVLYLYKDDIKHQMDKSIAEYVDADVYYDPGSFSLSLFRHFPHPTASISNFGIVCRNEFTGDTLMSVHNFRITADLFSLFGDQIRFKAIDLYKPRIFLTILEDGLTNYDIIKSDGEDAVEATQEQTSSVSVGIDSWSMSNGLIVYDDKSYSFFVSLEGIDHEGSGNFTLDVFDMHTFSSARKVVVEYDGVRYLGGQQIKADVTMNINLKENIFTFKENHVFVNDLGISFNGFMAMPSEDIEMDVSFSTENAGIKSLYSLIPSVYLSEYDAIEATGMLAFGGKVVGTYSGSSLPAFDISLQARDGRIKYPDMPLPLKDINLDMTIMNDDGILDHTMIDIRELNMLVGHDPINARLLIKNLIDYDMAIDVKAKIDLKNLGTVFPIEDMDLRGIFSMDLQAEGVVDTIRQIFPVIDARMSLKDGFFKNSMLTKPVDGLGFNTQITCSTGKIEDFVVTLNSLEMKMGSDQFAARGVVSNPLDYQWDIFANGRLNLQMISEMMPVEGVRYEGLLVADVQMEGRYSDLEAGRYSKIPTSGHVNIKDLKYESQDMPQEVVISSASATFSPDHIKVDHLKGIAGKSDFLLSGSIYRYMNYLFGDSEVLKGDMTLNSKLINVNEWMEQPAETTDDAGVDSVKMELPVIPKGINLKFQSKIGRIIYDNLILKKVKGIMIVSEGMLVLKALSFETLGGDVVMDGLYDTRDQKKPGFSYKLNMNHISIPGAFTNFNTVKTFAPMARVMDGNFSSEFQIEGMMNQDITPVVKTINGNGSVKIADAFIAGSKLIEGLNGLAGMNISTENLRLNDIKILASIEDGRAYVQPFDLNIDKHKIRVSGSIGADGNLDYLLETEVEAGEKGQKINALLSSLSGNEQDSTDTTIKLKIKVGGTYENPKFSLAGIASADGRSKLEADLKKEVSDKAEKVEEEAKSQIMEGIGHVLEGDTAALNQQTDSLKNLLNDDILDNLGQKGEEIKNSLQNLFKKKKKDENQ